MNNHKDSFPIGSFGYRTRNRRGSRLADEIVTLAGTCLRRLDLLHDSVPVVLGAAFCRPNRRA